MMIGRTVARRAAPLGATTARGQRHYSFYPPPEPFSSQSTRASEPPTPPPPPPPSSLSTFGASPQLLSKFLARNPTGLTLRSLLSLGGEPGSPPPTEKLLRSARFTAHELPIRLARRVDQYRSLPFIVGSNPYIAKIARLYASSFDSLASLGEITSTAENEEFTRKLEEMVALHSENVPTLSRGFIECQKYMPSAAITHFLDGAIHSRIGIRLIAEQHLALTHAHATGSSTNAHSVGIIDTQVNAADLIDACAAFVGDLCESTLGIKPAMVLEGDRSATFVGVSSHLSYCMTELLKNSYRATVERHLRLYGSSSDRPLPPITISLALSPTHLSIRIRDQGGGIHPRNLPHIFNYTFTTAGSSGEDGEAGGMKEDDDEGGPYAMQQVGGVVGPGGQEGLGALSSGGDVGLSSGMGTLAGLGYGLPMSRIYAEHGRGSLDIVSLYGHGCDTFIKVRANPLDQQ
ncbi:alpha-ketoacid dehydrogenase kinase [Acaromyces ingoldii]|uniref:Protein-serine/threonine kinase n=1 Tax=Acaromyces ingoldii TaxID=215250 RepID=A0A316YUA0_9BASI|nr:alpha-ketoacid dehydrogenase kinase [Acaromyces ingoldii]PWN92811.1 alpha-ketoacid dehydrogenase kinase [Acaromyces ingoldii]